MSELINKLLNEYKAALVACQADNCKENERRFHEACGACEDFAFINAPGLLELAAKCERLEGALEKIKRMCHRGSSVVHPRDRGNAAHEIAAAALAPQPEGDKT